VQHGCATVDLVGEYDELSLAHLTLMDPMGKTVVDQRIAPIGDDHFRTTVQLPATISTGIFVIMVDVNGEQYTQRIVVE
jgi:hypothetical protein